MSRIKILSLFILLILGLFVLTGCDEVYTAEENIRSGANNFNVARKIVVIDTRTDKLLLEIIGTFSLQNSTHNELEIICKIDENKYQKHFVYLNADVMYVVEDLEGKDIDKYYYNISYFPEEIGG